MIDNIPNKKYVDEANWVSTSPTIPEWEEAHYVMFIDDKPVGIFNDIMDTTNTKAFTLYDPKSDPKFRFMEARRISSQEYDEHVAFETFPDMQIVKETGGGAVLSFRS